MSNSTPNISWDDLVFEGRNKDYGAYALRHGYPYYLTFSTLVVLALLSIVIGPQIFKNKQINETETGSGQYVDPIEIKPPPIIEKTLVPKQSHPIYAEPEIVKNDVPVNQQMPTYKDAIANTDDTVIDAPISSGTGTIADVPVELPPQITVVDTPVVMPDVIKNPEFAGGMKECAKWLSNHLEYPPMAVRMGIEGKVVVEFTVNENGKISDATVKESLHRLCDQEAIRLVKSMPDWTPGEKNGVKTTQKYTLPIRFVLR